MRILLYGNCQLWGVKECLNLDNNEYIVDYLDCFMNDYEEEFIKEKYEKYDVIITQPISDDYRNKSYLSTKYLINNCAKKCKIIIVDSLYFDFYYCDLQYTFFKEKMLEVPEHYHYKYMMDCFKKNENIDYYINNYVNNIDLFKTEELLEKAEKSINELKERYRNNTKKYVGHNIYFISSAQYIENNYKDKLLFYSMNHPTSYLLRFISENIINILQIKHNNYRFYEIDNAKCIIYKCIQKVVNFRIDNCDFLTKNKTNLLDICKLYYETYNRINFC